MTKIQKKIGIIMLVLVSILFVSFISFCGKEDKYRAIDNIEAFARLYGYVRYFHPSDAASKIDWDRFAVYGVKKVEKAGNSKELKKILEELFSPLAPSFIIYDAKEKKVFDQSQIVPKNTDGMKVVAWQHYGVFLNNTYSIYRSIRLNRKNRVFPGGPIGCIAQAKDVSTFRGKEFIYKASVKAEIGKAQLWVRVDRPNRKVGFFDNMGGRAIGTKQWKTYEIKGKIDEDAQRIAFGFFLQGVGKVFVDDIQLFVKEDNQWKSVELKNNGFEEDKVGDAPKDWNAFGKGYILEVTDQTAAAGEKSFKVEMNIEMVEYPKPLFSEIPSIGEHINKKIGSGLACIIPLALYGSEIHTFPLPSAEAFKNLTAALEKEIPEDLTVSDLYVRWASVVSSWNVFQHFYPNFDFIEVDWKNELSRTLKKTWTDQNEKDFYYTLREMIAKLQDGLENVSHPLTEHQSGFPFRVEWIENQVVIVFSKDDRFKKGDIIISIDGVEAEKTLLEAETYFSGAPRYKRAKSMLNFGWGDKNTTAVLKIKRDEQEMEITATRNTTEEIREHHEKAIEELSDNIYYIHASGADLQAKELKSLIDKLANAKGIIVDTRAPDSYAYKALEELMSHVITENVTSPIWGVPKVIYPDREKVSYTDDDWQLEPKKPTIKGKVVFLIQARTRGKWETILSFVEHYKLGELLGQPTAGANGNLNCFVLPGNFMVEWRGMRILKQDHTQHHLIGIRPTVPMKRTFKGVKEGRDEFLEKAIEIIKGS